MQRQQSKYARSAQAARSYPIGSLVVVRQPFDRLYSEGWWGSPKATGVRSNIQWKMVSASTLAYAGRHRRQRSSPWHHSSLRTTRRIADQRDSTCNRAAGAALGAVDASCQFAARIGIKRWSSRRPTAASRLRRRSVARGGVRRSRGYAACRRRGARRHAGARARRRERQAGFRLGQAERYDDAGARLVYLVVRRRRTFGTSARIRSTTTTPTSKSRRPLCCWATPAGPGRQRGTTTWSAGGKWSETRWPRRTTRCRSMTKAGWMSVVPCTAHGGRRPRRYLKLYVLPYVAGRQELPGPLARPSTAAARRGGTIPARRRVPRGRRRRLPKSAAMPS